MCRDLDTVSRDGIVNELVVIRLQGVETFLNDVVAIKVFDQSDHVSVEC